MTDLEPAHGSRAGSAEEGEPPSIVPHRSRAVATPAAPGVPRESLPRRSVPAATLSRVGSAERWRREAKRFSGNFPPDRYRPVTRATDGGERASEVNEVRRVWNANAPFWDARMGEGNDFHLKRLLPSLERLLAPRAGERILEVACGNGQLARWMSERDVHVVATDLSENLIELARARSRGRHGRIDYRVVDASDRRALEQLGSGEYDAVVCNMALMDMPSVDALAEAAPVLLTSSGRLVFSVTHPCFNMGDAGRVARWSDEDGVVRESIGIEIHRYLTPRKVRGLAMIGQPEVQSYYERPLSVLLGAFLRSGLVLDALDEPGFPAAGEMAAEPWFSWSKSLREIPPALVARLVPRLRN